MGKTWKVTRDDGVDLGEYDRDDHAEQAAEDDASENGHTLRPWSRSFGSSDTRTEARGAGAHSYTITEIKTTDS
jgi:hypothetical protein